MATRPGFPTAAAAVADAAKWPWLPLVQEPNCWGFLCSLDTQLRRTVFAGARRGGQPGSSLAARRDDRL